MKQTGNRGGVQLRMGTTQIAHPKLRWFWQGCGTAQIEQNEAAERSLSPGRGGKREDVMRAKKVLGSDTSGAQLNLPTT
jgi:hypothetical protein